MDRSTLMAVADRVGLELTPEEIEKYLSEIPQVLEWMKVIENFNPEGTEEREDNRPTLRLREDRLSEPEEVNNLVPAKGFKTRK